MMAPVVFTSAIGLGELFGQDVRRCLGDPVWTTSETPQVWIDQQVTEQDGGLLLNWDVIEELFPPGVIDAMFAAYLDLLGWLCEADWAAPAPALLPASQAAVRAAVNDTGPVHPGRLLHQDFFALSAREPDRDALLWGDEGRLSYGELATWALVVAARLVADGVRPGDTVAVTMAKGPDQIAAVLGVLAAGAAYVPVGVDQPDLRRNEIYSSAGATKVLTAVPGDGPALSGSVPTSPDDLAYVIYTSGSTGKPKGVEVTHRAARNTIDEINSRYGLGPQDRVLAVSALDFDLSVYDVFGLLSVGGAVVLVEEQARREARQWAELVRRCDVTVWNTVPALLDMALVIGGVQRLRLALVSGDWVGLDLPGRLEQAAPECRLVALGGATEGSIWSNACDVTEVPGHWRSIPYGHPLRGQRYRVADGRGRDCPDFVPGELWIGGAGVARGYRGEPERTARQFVHHAGERWYRTGDLGRYWPDGTLEFLGRADDQVKIRGHRIELGEIEAALTAHQGVRRAAATRLGSTRIGAAVVAEDPGVAPEDLRMFLGSRLPAYMLPDELVVLPELPLSANGKVDRRALPALIAASAAQTRGEAPHGPLESELAQHWAALLEVVEVGRSESFFALGGDSLLATRLLENIRLRFGVDVTLRRLFTGPTIADLAALIEAAIKDTEEGVI
jgi:amino acid adenylation domain-containing protein